MALKSKKRPVPIKALRTQAHTKGGGVVLSVQTARTLDRRYKVMEMRKNGLPIHEIASTLGISVNTARDDIKEVLGSTATAMQESTEEARNLEIARFNSLLKRYQPLAEAGNLAACSMVLGISDRIRKLLSLDVPEIKQTDETAIRVYVGVCIDDV